VPLYEYKCQECGGVSEHLVGVGGDQPALACLKCGSEQLNQLISIVSINRGAEPATCCGGHVAGECQGSCDSQETRAHHHSGSCDCGHGD
jgi:putative FmdB family regulatory protein